MRKLFSVLFIFKSFFICAQTSPEKEIIQRMFKATESLRSAKFTMLSEERMVNGKYISAERLVKLQVKPKKIYFYSVKPSLGTEIIWKEGWNDNKMLVGPGSFPFVTFSMKSESSIARKDSHHPVQDIGFDYLTGMMGYYLKQYGERFYKYITINDTVQWDNHSCIVVSFDFKDFTEVNYTVKKKEYVKDIAKKFHLNDYSLLVMNPSIKDFEDVKEGQVIKISNFYSRNIVFYIDRITWLPLRQLLTDKKGLYEKYEMKSFIANPVFQPDEFTPEFKGYKF